VDLLAEQLASQSISRNGRQPVGAPTRRVSAAEERRRQRERDRLLSLLNEDALEEETVEIEVDAPYADGAYEEFGPASPIDLLESFQDFLEGYAQPQRRSRRRVSVREARRILAQQEQDRLIDWDIVIETAIRRVEEAGVVFIDEIDKTINVDGEY